MDYMGQDATMERARQLQTMLAAAYEQALQPGLSSTELRQLNKVITKMECELDSILQNRAQAQTPGGYYTPHGVMPATGIVDVGQPALVLGDREMEKKKAFPWWTVIVATGATAYFTMRG